MVLQFLEKNDLYAALKQRAECLMNVKFPSFPSRGTFVNRSEDNISNHGMSHKAKFYL